MIWRLLAPAYERRQKAFNRTIDEFYGIKTATVKHYTLKEARKSRFADPCACMASDYVELVQLRKVLALEAGDVFADLGCGTGRALFVFANSGVQRCVGIEFNHETMEECRKNVRRFRGNRNKIELIEADTATYRFSNETIVYLFNPVGERTLNAVLENLHDSLKRRPRRLVVCYKGAYSANFDLMPWLLRQKTALATTTAIYVSKLEDL